MKNGTDQHTRSIGPIRVQLNTAAVDFPRECTGRCLFACDRPHTFAG